MKKIKIIILYLFLLVIGITFNANSQSSVKLVTLTKNNIEIIKDRGPSEKKFGLAVTPTGLVTALGNPLSTATEYSEVDEVNLTVYTYNGAEFSFNGNVLVQFHITSSNYTLKTDLIYSFAPNKYFFKIGESVSKLQAAYPNSYTASSNGMLFFKLSQLTRTGTAPKYIFVTKNYDTNLVISYNSTVITSITYE